MIAHHKRMHTDAPKNEKKFLCTWMGCEHASGSKQNLQVHLRSHTQEKPFKCQHPGCNYACTVECSLVVHTRTHTSEKPYACGSEGCDYTCSVSASLVAHERTHTGERPYHCDFEDCDYKCSVSSSLVQHRRLHTGEKPYVCHYPDCEAAYAQASNLKTHSAMHLAMEARPYVCDIGACSQTFTQKSALDTHKRRHLGIKGYKCSATGCDEAFAASSERDAHYSRNHTKVGIRKRCKKQYRVSLVLKSTYSVDEECYIQFRNGCVPDSKTASAKLDFRITNFIDTIVIVECDEFGHKNYVLQCELARMINVYQSILNSRDADNQPMQPVVFLRYNCDDFTVDGERVKTKRKEREAVLLQYLAKMYSGEKNFTDPLSIVYLNYDQIGDRAAITLNPDYNEQMLKCVRDVIDARGISIYHKRKRDDDADSNDNDDSDDDDDGDDRNDNDGSDDDVDRDVTGKKQNKLIKRERNRLETKHEKQ